MHRRGHPPLAQGVVARRQARPLEAAVTGLGRQGAVDVVRAARQLELEDVARRPAILGLGEVQRRLGSLDREAR
jgi:hypothetical protein